MKSLYTKWLLLLIPLLASCSDIFEEQIDDETVILITPPDSIQVDQFTQTFRWDPVGAALQYRVQIVSPDFNNILDFVLDSTVKATMFSYTLEPGTYQWRVRGENGSSETLYSTRTLVVDTAGLTDQTVLLNSPADNFVTSSTVVSLSWQSMFGATSYKVEADELTGNFSAPLVLDATTPFNFFSHDFLTDGEYIWRIKATNATQESNYSEVRSFIIDRTPPEAVTLTSPLNGNTVPEPVNLAWSASTSTDIKNYQLFASTIIGTDTTLITGFPKTVSGTSYSFTEGVSGDKIAWKVKAIDQAGNVSSFSAVRGFTISF